MVARLAAFVMLALLVAGCASPSAPRDEAVPGPAVAIPVRPALVHVLDVVDWNATLATTVCATVVVTACGSQAPPLMDPTNTDSDDLPRYIHATHGRALAGGQLRLEWDATTPATERLRLVAGHMTGCPEACSSGQFIAMVEGPSPLTLDLQPQPFRPDDSLVVVVAVAEMAPGLAASAGQPLRLTGPLDFLADLGLVVSVAG